MNNMTGRLEKEIKEREKMHNKIKSLPPIIGDFYYHLEASDKSYTTIKSYINYIVHFMLYCTDGKKIHDFYKNVTSSTINMYMSSLKFATDNNGNDIKIGNSIRATRWSALNTFFTFLKSNNLINSNPIEQTFRPSGKKDKQVTYLTEDEIKTCFSNINLDDKNRFKNRDLCIISMGISTGLRVSAITQINLEDINSIIISQFDDLLRKVAAVMTAYKCDIVILSGRPTSLKQIENLFLKYYPVSPNRLKILNDYRVGRWYPFQNGDGYFTSQKSIVAVGALLGYIASNMGGYEGLSFDLSELKEKLLPTTEYFGIMNSNTNEMTTPFITPKQNRAAVVINDLPIKIGARQLDSSSYPSRAIYKLDFNDEKIELYFAKKGIK